MNAVSVPPNERHSPDWMLTNYDRETTFDPDLEAELRRLTVLRTFPVLRTSEADPDYEILTELAMSLLDAPMACIKLVDLSSIRVVASAGCWPKDVKSIARKSSFCAHVVQGRNGVMVVKDVLEDDRFRSLAQVVGVPHIRFYAGAPLVSSEGAKIGSVCIFDTQPRPHGLTEQEYGHMMELSKLVVDMMEEARKKEMGKTGGGACFKKQDRSHSLTAAATSAEPTLSSGRVHRSTGNLSSHTPNAASEPVSLASFIRGLKIAMESFPKQVDLQIYMDPSCPLEFRVANDLSVFRSAVAVLTSACERTKTGYIRLTVQADEHGHMTFVCEDTGPNIDPSFDIFDYSNSSLHDSPSSSAGEGGCIRIDPQTGQVMSGAVCMPSPPAATSAAAGYSLHSVAVYMAEIGGRYGYEPRNAMDGSSGSLTWFSFPTDAAP